MPLVSLYAILFVFLVVTVPSTVWRGLLIDPDGASVPEGIFFKVMTYNNQNGYNTDGNFNGRCYADIVNEWKPDYVVIPEGDSMHGVTGNRDALDYLSSTTALHINYGPPGYVDAVGVAALSSRQFERDNVKKHQIVALPKPTPNDLNRFMLVDTFEVNGISVTVAGVHLEWFGDPSKQTEFIVNYFNEYEIDANIIVLGDFNLEPSGSNNNAPDATAWKVMTDNSWKTATAFGCNADGHETVDSPTEGHQCNSDFTTCLVAGGPESTFPSMNYQLDWIVYKGKDLKLEGDVRQELGQIHSKLGNAYCSDHAPLMANFQVGE